jgi:hypothetical protein
MITKSLGGGHWNCPEMAPIQVQIMPGLIGKHTMIGFCPIGQFKRDGTHYQLSNVCFFYGYTGDVF